MKNNYLPYYVFERLHSIKQHLKAYAADREEKRLHNLRIEIKKIKALYAFLDSTHEEKFHPPDLKRLFKSAGKIREHHIHCQITKNLIRFPEKFILQLKKETLHLEDQFVKQIPVHLHVLDHLTKVLLLPVEFPAKRKTQTFFKKEQKKVLNFLQKKSRKKAHQSRTKIKQLLFVYDALPDKIQSTIKFDRRNLLKQETKIGQWHNTLATVEFLNKRKLNSDLKILLSKLKKQEELEFEMLFRDVLTN